MKNSDLRAIVETYFGAEGLANCFWVSEKVQGSKVEIFIDSDEGISYDICRKVSRKIEEVLDTTKEYGESYTLDVSSPGVGTALIMPRQYKKNIGRTIDVRKGEEKIKGILSAADDEKIIVDVEEEIKEGKKKKKIINNIEIAYSDISVAKIKITF